MRITGTLAEHCHKQGELVGQTGAEFVRSCIRQQLKARAVDWREDPTAPHVVARVEAAVIEEAEADPLAAERASELSGQQLLEDLQRRLELDPFTEEGDSDA